MITRSDLHTPNSLTDFEASVDVSYPESVQEYPMDHSEFQYVGTTYPSSIYDRPHHDGAGMQLEQNESMILKNIVGDMVTSAASPDSQSLPISNNTGINNSSISRSGNVVQNDKNISASSALKSPINVDDKFSMSLHDELESLTYSQPPTPSEPLVSPMDYTNPLTQIENIPFSSPYKEDFESDICDKESLRPTCLERRNYDTSALMYGTDDLTTFTGLVNCNEVLKTSKKHDIRENLNDTIVCCYRNTSPYTSHDDTIQTDSVASGDENIKEQEIPPEDNKKGKISGLQRHALDMIFSVTDRPSRGLVLHIAGELRLHHITVKNFFSNGRRRLRRAAARLNDPERTRRENQRRKEKRKLAAITAAANMSNSDKGNGSFRSGADGSSGSQASRDPPVLSPERRALMEKLAVKVQRSVAQRGLAASFGESLTPSSKLHMNSQTLYQRQISTNPTDTSVIPSQAHSRFHTSLDSVRSYDMQQIEEPYLKQNEEEFASIFSYSETDAASSYTSSPDQNNFNLYASIEQENSPYDSIGHEEGPFSPTSWQTLLHS